MTSRGISEVTRLLAPITEFWPIVTPFRIVAFTPSQTLSPMITGAGIPERGSSGCQSESVIRVFAPQITFSPRTIFLKAAITVPLNPQSFPMRTSASRVMVEIMQGRLMPIRFALEEERKVQFSPTVTLLPGYRLKYALP